MAYILNKYNGQELVVLQDGVLDTTTTSIGLLGRNYIGYGEVQNENFLFLLENFAGSNPPIHPIVGQTWYDSSNKKLNAYDGINWINIGAAEVSPTPPAATAVGSLWFKSTTKQLFILSADGWSLIAPEGDPRFGETRIKAVVLRDTELVNHIVLVAYVNGTAQFIIAAESFTIYFEDIIQGFEILIPGINMSSSNFIKGTLKGNADTSSRLETGRLINGVFFDGSSNITIKSSTTGSLNRGTYLLGNNFDGSTTVTWSVDASSSNIVGKVVARDSTGSFEASNISATQFTGPLYGNVTVDYGFSTFKKIVVENIEGFTFSGLSARATKLEPGRNINGVYFDGTNDITVSASANTLTGTTLANNVLFSSLTTVGTLSSLTVADAGISVGTAGQLTVSLESNQPVVATSSTYGLKIKLFDNFQSDNKADFAFITSDTALSLGGSHDPAFIGDLSSTCNIGLPSRPFGQAYISTMYGVATSAQYADLAENYLSDKKYEPGTVLEFGGINEVTIAENETIRVAGVVTTNPAHLMNSKLKGENVVAIALQGRVPCKVLGPVKKGDMLQSAGNGYAKAAKNPQLGTIIGKSLEDFNEENGVIEVCVGRL